MLWLGSQLHVSCHFLTAAGIEKEVLVEVRNDVYRYVRSSSHGLLQVGKRSVICAKRSKRAAKLVRDNSSF